jgi:phosphoglycerate dehydrogenase-like enzyme
MNATGPLRVALLYPPLAGPVAETQPDGASADVRFVPYEIDHVVRQARRTAPAEPHPDEPAVGDELADALAWADAVLCLDAPRDLPRLAPGVRWVQALGSGVEQFRVSLDGGSGVVLTNGAGLGSDAIAEWVVGRILEHYKRFADHRRLQQAHTWEASYGRRMTGAHVLIIGTGAIGVATAARLAPFGLRLRGVRADPSKGTGHPAIEEVVAPDALHDALGWADVVVLAASSNQSGPMLGAAELAAMRPGSFLVNVARGTMLDEAALVEALATGPLEAAALDVVATEPLPSDSPLWDVPGLLISPHSSVAQDGYFRAGAELFWANVQRFAAGEPLANVVDTSSWTAGG